MFFNFDSLLKAKKSDIYDEISEMSIKELAEYYKENDTNVSFLKNTIEESALGNLEEEDFRFISQVHNCFKNTDLSQIIEPIYSSRREDLLQFVTNSLEDALQSEKDMIQYLCETAKNDVAKYIEEKADVIIEKCEERMDYGFIKEGKEKGFINACDLESGDTVQLADGSTGTVDSVEENENHDTKKVYNIEVFEAHTYFVGESGVLVHNENCDKSGLGKLARKANETSYGKSSEFWALNEEYDGIITRYMPDGSSVIDVTELPGSSGIEIPRRLTDAEMTFLTKEYGVEFAQIYELGSGTNGSGGKYMLFSGVENRVSFDSIDGSTILINHTHPAGAAYPSSADMSLLNRLRRLGSPQKSSQIIPIGKDTIRFNVDGIVRE